MVETHKLPMQRLARKIEEEILSIVRFGGVEAEMAIRGALTTPGTRPPLAVLDLGGGSTDAALISEDEAFAASIWLARRDGHPNYRCGIWDWKTKNSRRTSSAILWQRLKVFFM